MNTKEMFLKENKLSDSVIKSYNMLFKKILPLEDKLGKDLKDFNYEDLLQLLPYIKSTSYQSINVKWTLLKKYMEHNNNLNYTKITQDNLKQYIEEKILRYVTREQLLNAVNNCLDNAQDKAIVMLLFEGVMGKGYSDLVTLKTEDIDFENNLIRLEDRTIYIHDEETMKILDATRLQKVYEKFSIGTAIATTGDASYDLNTKSDYLIKTKPSAKNHNGLDHLKESGIKSRLDKIINTLDMEGLTGLSIYHSGIMEKILKIEKENNITFNISDIGEQLKNLNVKRIEPLSFYRGMKQLKSQNNIA